jgi:hypothetical protein
MISHILLLAGLVSAQTVVIGDTLIAGKLSVGTTTTNGRVFILSTAATTVPFQVSGVDLTPFLRVERTGDIGIGVEPQANLDVFGVADSSDTSVQLRNGNAYPSASLAQITFGYDGSADRRHSIRTMHATTTVNNQISFYLWTPSDDADELGTLNAFALQTTTSGAGAHVNPTGDTPIYDLTVSRGGSLGAGEILAAAEVQPSSRKLKTDITYLSPQDSAVALSEVSGLKHARFRYKTKRGVLKRPLMTGLMHDEAPQSVRGPGQTVSFDERVNNAELAMQELIRRLESLEGKAR